MRWGSSKVKFARPIRWIVAAFDGNPVLFDVEDVPSSLLSHGHRFYAPALFEAKTLEELTSKLRANFVEPELEKRKERILAETHAIAQGTPEISDDLLDENAFLCEWPTAIRGTFPESYLELPEPVLVTAMAKHERMFPIRDNEGKLTNSFVFIRNSGEDETVKRGCEWVLGARFNDARFFYEQDQKHNLDYFLEKTNDILFQAQLGTVRQRADRLSKLCKHLAESVNFSEPLPGNDTIVAGGFSEAEAQWAGRAGLYAKADLATGLVSELSSLQGVIGGEYAKREGMSEYVSHAISTQYTTPSSRIDSNKDRLAGLLIVADHLDKLAGYLGLGLEPSGSSDPYGLRKSVTTLIRFAENWVGMFGAFVDYMQSAFDLYHSQGFELDRNKATESLAAIFKGRYEALYDNYRYDVLNAAIPENPQGLTTVWFVRQRLEKMDKLKDDVAFVQAAIRPINIVAAARKKGEDFTFIGDTDLDLIGTPDGRTLLNALNNEAGHKSEDAYHADLVKAINNFFDNNMIMADDLVVRRHRLNLASGVAERLLDIGDFTKLEG